MNRFLYSLFLYLIAPLVILRLYLRSRKNAAYGQRWAERFGFVKMPNSDSPVIWIHSVSVGETIASAPLVRELQDKYPNHRILITTMTPTGSEQVHRIHGDSVEHTYACYDFPGAVHRFLKRTRPVISIIIDTELWPNTIAACQQRNIPIILVNARLSERSARGYGKLASLTRNMLRGMTMVAAQNRESGQRFLTLGLPESKLAIPGSIKFDLTVDAETVNSGHLLREHWQQHVSSEIKILIAASTHEGEDQLILDAFKLIQSQMPEIRLLLVPRHQERFNDVFSLSKANNLETVRYSENPELSQSTRVIIGDTMGEMMKLYAASDIAFVGGSLVPTGGHNMLEPAALGLPVLSGPHIFNFPEISQQLTEAGGMELVNNKNELAKCCIRLLGNPDQMKLMSDKASAFVDQNRGSLDKVIRIISQHL